MRVVCVRHVYVINISDSKTNKTVALDVSQVVSNVDMLLMKGAYTVFFNYADVINTALAAQGRRTGSSIRQTSTDFKAVTLRTIESDKELLTSTNIQALATAFSQDPPTLDNAMQTLGALASFLEGSGGVSSDATRTSVGLVFNATLLISQNSEPLSEADGEVLLQNVLVSVTKLLSLLRPMSSLVEQATMPLLLPPLQIAVLHSLRTEMAGAHYSCPSHLCSSAVVSTYSKTWDAFNIVDRQLSPPLPELGTMQVLLSSATIADVQTLEQLVSSQGLVDLHWIVWKSTWGRASGLGIISHIHSFYASVDGAQVSMVLTDAGRLSVTIPYEETSIKTALGRSSFVELQDVPVRDLHTGDPDLKTMLLADDFDANGQLDLEEMYTSVDILLKHYFFWECVQWQASSNEWTSKGCIPVRTRPGSVTCACAHNPSIFAVQIDNSKGRCGDGRVTGLEECDDGNTAAGDGCSEECKVERSSGYFCPGGLTVSKSDCRYGRKDCAVGMLGLSCEYMCSQPVEPVNKVCTGTRWLATSVKTQMVEGNEGSFIVISMNLHLSTYLHVYACMYCIYTYDYII